MVFENQRKCILERLRNLKKEIFDAVFSVVETSPESECDGSASSLAGAVEGNGKFLDLSCSSEQKGPTLTAGGVDDSLLSTDSGDAKKKKKKRKRKTSTHNDLAVGSVRSTTLFLDNLDRILSYLNCYCKLFCN